MARKIEVSLEADTSDFERGMQSASGSVDKLEANLKNADGAASRFDGGLDKLGGGLENTTQKFRATNDLAGGLGAILGIEGLESVTMYATGIADMADGMGGLLVPALAKGKGAFAAMNATMLANPIFLVIAALTALTVAFVVAYKKSETFRNIVHGAMDGVKKAVQSLVESVSKSVSWVANKLASIAELIVRPYREAFRAIAWLWNNTVGRLSFSIPGWVPGVGGKGFDVPDIPMLAKGGIVTGPTLAMIGEAGPEAVIPLSGPNARQFGGGPQEMTVVLQVDLDTIIRKRVRLVGGGSVQAAYGSN